MTTKWKPAMFPFEQEFYDRCPKSVLYLIAKHLAIRLHGEGEATADALRLMIDEWLTLNGNEIVPQLPPNDLCDTLRRAA